MNLVYIPYCSFNLETISLYYHCSITYNYIFLNNNFPCDFIEIIIIHLTTNCYVKTSFFLHVCRSWRYFRRKVPCHPGSPSGSCYELCRQHRYESPTICRIIIYCHNVHGSLMLAYLVHNESV